MAGPRGASGAAAVAGLDGRLLMRRQGGWLHAAAARAAAPRLAWGRTTASMLHLALWTAAITSAQLQNLTLYHVTRAQSIRQLIVRWG